VPAVYAEYHGGGGCDPAGIDAYVRGCLNVLADLGMTDPVPAPPPAPSLVVEDDRPGSGHMQVNHPAPCEGFFEPAVELGQRVRAGDLLGTVTDLLGTRAEAVRAAYAGLVLVLHTFARVGEGESVAVVLETDRPHPGPGQPLAREDLR
jgi:predicted deacylase